MASQVDPYSAPYLDTSAPPQYEVQNIDTENTCLPERPIVVPQSTNLFFIKTFSPFSRCYSPTLANLPNPIPEEEFLAFIDRLNDVFISNPIFQAAHVSGGMLLGSQVLPAQAVGGLLQIGSLMASASVSFVRVRKFMKSANTTIFAPRGLVVKILTTKKMMAAVGFTDTDAKGKLKLPPLNGLDDLAAYNDVSAIQCCIGTKATSTVKDPRMLRLQVLENHISPLTFDVADPGPESKLHKFGHTPLRWLNGKQLKKFDDAKAKSMKKREKKAAEVQEAEIKANNQISAIQSKMQMVKKDLEGDHVVSNEYNASHGTIIEVERENQLHELEDARKSEMQRRDTAIANLYKDADRKMNKVYKKEEKVANRILWIVITKADDIEGDSFFRTETVETV